MNSLAIVHALPETPGTRTPRCQNPHRRDPLGSSRLLCGRADLLTSGPVLQLDGRVGHGTLTSYWYWRLGHVYLPHRLLVYPYATRPAGRSRPSAIRTHVRRYEETDGCDIVTAVLLCACLRRHWTREGDSRGIVQCERELVLLEFLGSKLSKCRQTTTRCSRSWAVGDHMVNSTRTGRLTL